LGDDWGMHPGRLPKARAASVGAVPVRGARRGVACGPRSMGQSPATR
jgi:hypothetical protein